MAKVVRADQLVKGDEIVFYGEPWVVLEAVPDKEWASNALQWERRIRVTFVAPRSGANKVFMFLPDEVKEVVNR
jgi:hypothetical protein